MKQSLFLCTITLLLWACGGESPTENTPTTDSLVTDTLTVDTASMVEVPIDTLVEDTAVVEEEGLSREEVKTFEKSVDFCECVKKQYKINKAIEKTEDDAEIDRLFDEMTALEEGDCKEMLSGKGSHTKDQVEERKRRVEACLKGMD